MTTTDLLTKFFCAMDDGDIFSAGLIMSDLRGMRAGFSAEEKEQWDWLTGIYYRSLLA